MIRPHRTIYLLATLLGLLAASASADTRDTWVYLFQAGNEALQQDDLEGAIRRYESAVAIAHSSPLHNNIGTAKARAGQVGEAVYHFRKALALDPQNSDARRNLAYVLEEAGLPQLPTTPLQSLAQSLSLSTWTWVAAITFWCAVLSWAIPRLFGWQSLALAASRVAFAVALLISGLALAGYHTLADQGVVIRDVLDLRVSPLAESAPLAKARAGETVRLTRHHHGFWYVETPDGRRGWAPASDLGPVWTETP